MRFGKWKNGSEGYNYVRCICESMAKKVHIEDFKLLDEKTMKEKRIFQAMPLFKFSTIPRRTRIYYLSA
ncbi:hypothetical protein ABCS21_010585 (plasmid) [Campylobacter coli]